MLKDKIALVTGAAQGIGKAIATRLAREGAHVALCDMNEILAQQTATEIAALGVKTISHKVNVTQEKDAQACVDKVIDTFGRIDILVNNAGITRDGLLIRMKEEDWDIVLAVNLRGTFNFTKAVAKSMMKNRAGKIVNVASIIGLIGNAGQANYAASKAGVIGLTKSVAKELAPRNVNVNAVAPGFIDTAMTQELPEEVRKKMLELVPLGRMGTPQDVAEVVLFLCSDLAKYVTGQVITVDGGMVM